ncbi:MAG: DUF2335 domain-containing protein [Lachnospiraceae bacterium]|nr:DUF2335 domain-containing protein [Lachnospiraceae bacterium]
MNQLEDIQNDLNSEEDNLELETIQEAEIVDILQEEGIDDDAKKRIIGVIKREVHSGPLPSPETLKKYSELPGVVDVITNMAVSEMNHRHEMEKKMVDSDCALNQSQINYVNASIDLKKRLQIFGFIITILLIGLGFVCLILNRNIASVTLFVSGIGSLCFVLFYGKKAQGVEESDNRTQDDEKPTE